MMWNGGWGWWGPGLIFMIFCMVMMVWMMTHHGSHPDQSQRQTSDEAERILADRLARGEIDTDEYERRLAALHQTSKLDRT